MDTIRQLKQLLAQINYDLSSIIGEADNTETESNYEFDYDRYHITVERVEHSNDSSYFYVAAYPKPWPDMEVHDGLRIFDGESKGREWREIAECVMHLILVLIHVGY